MYRHIKNKKIFEMKGRVSLSKINIICQGSLSLSEIRDFLNDKVEDIEIAESNTIYGSDYIFKISCQIRSNLIYGIMKHMQDYFSSSKIYYFIDKK